MRKKRKYKNVVVETRVVLTAFGQKGMCGMFGMWDWIRIRIKILWD